MPPTNDYLDKFDKLMNNNNNITILVTVIILITFITFTLILYNFLSKSSANCKNINKAYKDVYNMDEEYNISDSNKVLTNSQGDRTIDISFSCSLHVINNCSFVSNANVVSNTPTTYNDINKMDLDINFIEYNPIVSNGNNINLNELNEAIFVDTNDIIQHNIFSNYFDINNFTKSDKNNNQYYIFTCSDNFKAYIERVPTGGFSKIFSMTEDTLNDIFSWTQEEKLYDISGYYLYNKRDKNLDDTFDTSDLKYMVYNSSTNQVYIPIEYVKIRQNTFKYTYSATPGNLNNIRLSRDIEILNNSINIQTVLNKIHNNHILTAYNCCNSGEYQNNYVDICILKNCLHMGVRCLDFQIFNYNQKPIIASSTMDSLYIKETFNYLELDPVLDIIKDYLHNDELGNTNTSPLFLHFRVMSLSQKIYETLIESIFTKLNGNIFTVSTVDTINNVSLIELNNKIVVFINPYHTTNNYIFNELDIYISNVVNYLKNTDTNFNRNSKIYKSGYISNNDADLILYKNDNYDIYKDSHNKSKPTLALPESNTKNNNNNFLKYMYNNITFIPMKFQEVDNFLQVVIYIFITYGNNSGFLLKNSIDSTPLEINIQQDGTQLLSNNIY